jgi:O-acetyl-ADP-ribose deacetylase (regulator of RNase III)
MSIETVEGDLLDQQVDAIVNAWNRNTIPWWLLLPQGVSGAIKRRGTAPFRELRKYGRMALGEAVWTGAGALPFKGIVHVAGINDFWRGSERTTRLCVRNVLAVVWEKGLESIAFPLIGTGSGGLSAAVAEKAMLEEFEVHGMSLRIVLVKYRPSP